MKITGAHIIGLETIETPSKFQSHNPVTDTKNSVQISEGTNEMVEKAIAKAHEAFKKYKNISRQKRAAFLRKIADHLKENTSLIVQTAMKESGLPEARLKGELGRTAGYFVFYADYIERGLHLDSRIDTAIPDRQPFPKPDIRSINQPLGVVGIFGASNFPLAFSVGGGDTASALASGCTVVAKGHEGHPMTSELVARCIQKSCKECSIPDGVHSMIQGTDYQISYTLVEHPLVQAIGFTGSVYVGRLLFDKAVARPTPIPFYGELGSINPVVFCPNILEEKHLDLASGLLNSLTLGAGQFCTNPGLVFAIKGNALDSFIEFLKNKGSESSEQVMLMPRIAATYHKAIDTFEKNAGVELLHKDETKTPNSCSFNLFKTSGKSFIENENLQTEIFGPSTLVVACENAKELKTALSKIHGQLTGTIWMHENDKNVADDLLEIFSQKVGRIVFNGYPTGVEVTHAMVHGGPYPASTDSKTTSVGTLAIGRFMRPVSYQQTPQDLLPTDLKNENPDKLNRLVNGVMTNESL